MTQDFARTNAAAPAAPEDADYARAHPLTMFGLDALIAGSARLRPERAALADHCEEGRAALAFAELDFAIGAFVARLREFDIEPGARILLCCPPRAQTLIAITAIIAAGFEPVLAPLGLPQSALIAAANASRAEALMAPVRFAKLDFEQALLGVAAQCPSIRLLGALSPEPIDGAVDFSLQGLRARPRTLPAGALISESWTPGDRAMIGTTDASGAPVFLAQGALLAAGLDRRTARGAAVERDAAFSGAVPRRRVFAIARRNRPRAPRRADGDSARPSAVGTAGRWRAAVLRRAVAAERRASRGDSRSVVPDYRDRRRGRVLAYFFPCRQGRQGARRVIA
jgi:hypothetical protein